MAHAQWLRGKSNSQIKRSCVPWRRHHCRKERRSLGTKGRYCYRIIPLCSWERLREQSRMKINLCEAKWAERVKQPCDSDGTQETKTKSLCVGFLGFLFCAPWIMTSVLPVQDLIRRRQKSTGMLSSGVTKDYRTYRH